MQPFSGNQRPDLVTSLMNMSLVLRLPRKMHPCRSSSNVPRLPRLSKILQKLHALLTFDKVQNPLRRPRETASEHPKVVQTCRAFNILTWKRASRYNGVHLFNISTSKSAPKLVCFVDFDFEMCFAPQWRPLFRHLNFQKWSKNGVFCAFWLRHVLRAKTVCNFSSLIWPDGSAPAALAHLLFDPPEPQTIGKNMVLRGLSTFASSFFCLFPFSDLVSSSLLLSDSSHLCLPICPYCRKFEF